MIPLSVPNISGNEWKYVKDCLDTGWVSSVGSYVSKMEEVSAVYSGVKKAIATSNGTAALHTSLLLAGVKKDHLVILSNITFVAPANVIKYIGADPILMDIDANTWQLDVKLLEKFLNCECVLKDSLCYHISTGKKVSAIVPVHVLGNMADMEKLLPLAAKYHLPVVEDATESLGSTYKDKAAGSFGLFGCLSYNGNKIITTGGGGMILTNDLELAKKAKHITTQAKTDGVEYYHDEIGYNYRMVNILAAMGVAQMEQLPGFIERKRSIRKQYNEGLSEVEGFRPQVITDYVKSNCWLYTAVFERSKELLVFLDRHNIQTRPFWVPMNQLPAFANDIYCNESDIAGNVYNKCLSLPCSTNITDTELKEVIEKIKQFYD
jgi:perosamine synthetase